MRVNPCLSRGNGSICCVGKPERRWRGGERLAAETRRGGGGREGRRAARREGNGLPVKGAVLGVEQVGKSMRKRCGSSAEARGVRASRATRSGAGRVGGSVRRLLLREAQSRGVEERERVDVEVAGPAGKRVCAQASQLETSGGGTVEGDAPRGPAPCRAVAHALRRTSRNDLGERCCPWRVGRCETGSRRESGCRSSRVGATRTSGSLGGGSTFWAGGRGLELRVRACSARCWSPKVEVDETMGRTRRSRAW